ncbi:unnamed protein product [Coregonus sp. 'balchen']|nr:unnamed protein product [Coregonus sp. 'balchen']
MVLVGSTLWNTPVQSRREKTKIRSELEKLCDHIPGPAAPKLCREQVDKNFPLSITFLTSFVKPAQVCSVLGLCGSQEQCENVIMKYAKMLMDMLLSYVTPEAICTLIQVCHGMETPVLESAPLSDCDSCLTLAVLTRLQLGSNASEPQTASFLGSLCQLHPNTLPKCDDFTQLHGHQLKGVLGKPESALNRVGLCGAVREAEKQGEDLCTLGTSYRCRDLKTALECGTVSFCQKFLWK